MLHRIVLLATIFGLTSLAVAQTTLPATLPHITPNAVVAQDGSGQYTTIQAAINASPQTMTRENPWVILVKPGTYKEIVYIQREKRFTRLIGEDPITTTITYNLRADMKGLDGLPIGTFRTPTVQVDADDFTFENLTLENSAGRGSQALAVRVDGDRVVFRNCRFLGFQDTIFVNRGRQYFEYCTIVGATDFIFGGATAFFESCAIHCSANGYITAASTPAEQPYGLVFMNCRIVGDTSDVRTYLGRPWRPYAGTIFAYTEMSEVVRQEGWHNWNQPEREQTSRYREYRNTGPGAGGGGGRRGQGGANRVGWIRQLNQQDANNLTVESVLGGADAWNPKQ